MCCLKNESGIDTNIGAGCHINGGNIVQANATLFTNDLQRNGLADPDSLYQLMYSGKGRMPGFGKECAPRVSCRKVGAAVCLSRAKNLLALSISSDMHSFAT
jgi:hypothetical protein